MKFAICCFVLLGAGIAAAAEPATNPATFSLHGRINIAAGLDLQPADLSRTVIYLDSDPRLDAIPLPADPAVCAQKNRTFTPNFLVIPKGTTVEFPNFDHFAHNVFSRSAVAPAFDMDRYPYGQSKSRVFDKTGVIQLFCNIHPFMKAIIFVTPNPCFTHANPDGTFELANIPPGKYQIVAWQERCEDQRQTIEVGPSNSQEISFTLNQSRSSILANDPPQHTAGYGVARGLGVKRDTLDLPVVGNAHEFHAPTTQATANP